MTDTGQAAQRLGRWLQVSQNFVPLSLVLGAPIGAEAAFDVCLARLQGEDAHIVALLADHGGSVDDAALRAEALRRALGEMSAIIVGRVHATVWVIASEQRASQLAAVLGPFEDGHFLSKVLVGRGVLGLDGTVVALHGRAQTRPKGSELGAAFLWVDQDPGQEAVDHLQQERVSDQANARRLLAAGPVPATWSLLALNAVGFALQMALSHQLVTHGLASNEAHRQAMLTLGANVSSLTLGSEPWRVLSSAFLHDNLIHLGFNMAALFSLGSIVERLAGPWKLLWLYVGAAIFAGFLSALALPAGVPSLGASGAILGFAGVLLAPKWRRDPGFPQDLAKRLNAWLGRSIVWLFVIGGAFQVLHLPLQFDNAAHFGGLLTGFIVGYLYPPFLVRQTR